VDSQGSAAPPPTIARKAERADCAARTLLQKSEEIKDKDQESSTMAPGPKIAKTADRKKVMDTTKSTDCPKCGKTTRIVKRVKDRERGVPGGIYISCSACEFFEKL
jgi:DNA-directed RNA polymerase subunit M/transcription elongation factor TFIIS